MKCVLTCLMCPTEPTDSNSETTVTAHDTDMNQADDSTNNAGDDEDTGTESDEVDDERSSADGTADATFDADAESDAVDGEMKTAAQKRRAEAFESADHQIVNGRITRGSIVPMVAEGISISTGEKGMVTPDADAVCFGSLPGRDSPVKVNVSSHVYEELVDVFPDGITTNADEISVTEDNHVTSLTDITEESELPDDEIDAITEETVSRAESSSLQYMVTERDEVKPVLYVPVYDVTHRGGEFTVGIDGCLSETAALRELVTYVDDSAFEFGIEYGELNFSDWGNENFSYDFDIADCSSKYTSVKTYEAWTPLYLKIIHWIYPHIWLTGAFMVVYFFGLLTFGFAAQNGSRTLQYTFIAACGVGLLLGWMLEKFINDGVTSYDWTLLDPTVTDHSITSVSQSALAMTSQYDVEEHMPDPDANDTDSETDSDEPTSDTQPDLREATEFNESVRDGETLYRSVTVELSHTTDTVTLTGTIDGEEETWVYETLQGGIYPEKLRSLITDNPVHDDEIAIQVRSVEAGDSDSPHKISDSGKWVITHETE